MKAKELLLIQPNWNPPLNIFYEEAEFPPDYSIKRMEMGEMAVKYLKRNKIDLAIINLEGIQKDVMKELIILSHLLNDDFEIPFILLSEWICSEVRREIYNSSPSAHLLKPIDAAQLSVTIERILQCGMVSPNNPLPYDLNGGKSYPGNDSFFIREKGVYHKIILDDLEKVVSDGDIIYIHLKSGLGPFTASLCLKKFQKQFPFPSLQRINKSCIINLRHLSKFDNNYVWVNEKPILIGARYKKEFLKKVKIVRTG
ncbi:DNA-binding response regulator [Echinicola jeungdonensis]|uniref:LytR/AlgR family response regulator transcription factor n=1 Tax=Echinicola jeungdonensis TaxID=709343 RepID=A0ABV5J2M9_9BACT|nr:DNA-binding response regulator [Echinicola jeungdonensis]MDN3671130.1 DNA-binding response regulator [Echinicola jeungdonensis]